MINVYVAGASRNRERARRFILRVEEHPDMRITYNWIPDIDAAIADGVTDDKLSDADRKRYAESDLNGLAEADAAVFLMEASDVGRGSWVELGYAIAVREAESDPMHVIIVSGGARRSIFSAVDLVDYELTGWADNEQNDGEAFEVLAELADAFAREPAPIGTYPDDFNDDGSLRQSGRVVRPEDVEPVVPPGALDSKGRP